MVRANAPKCLKASHSRHGKIHDDNIRKKLEIALASQLTGFCLRDHGHLRLGLQQQAKASAHDGMIIDKEDADHAIGVNGICAVMRTPCGWDALTSKTPPRCATRSDNPRKPKCPGCDACAAIPIPSSQTLTTIFCASERTSISTRDACAWRKAFINPS